MNPIPPIWTSLEIVKLIVAGLTPLMVIIIGFWISRSLKRLEHHQWTNQKVIERRIGVFDELAPLLNDLLCYFTFVGCWKDLTPSEVVGLKRKMDRIVHVNAPLFSKDFITRYHEFIGVCYCTYSGWGKDAQLRTLFGRRKEAAGSKWVADWHAYFVDDAGCSNPADIKSGYDRLMKSFSTELGVGLQPDYVPSGRIPANIN